MNINLIYTNSLCLCNKNYIAHVDTTVQYCAPSDVMVIWLMEEEQQAPYELHYIVAFRIPL